MGRIEDEEHLRILSVAHYVVGPLAALWAFPTAFVFGVGAVVFGSGLLSLAFTPADPHWAAGGGLLAVIGVGILAVGIALPVCVVLAGWFLARHRHHGFCLGVAVVLCVFVPVGTALGVLTLVVLLRPSVKALFEAAEPAGAQATSAPL